MRDFSKRIILGLATGYIFLYYGEFVFWATPDREGMTAGSLVATWLVYALFAYVFLCVVSVFRARSVSAVFLAGAFFGWYEEGIFVQTMYGTPDGPFPMSISFTGLAWHALLDVLVGWYLVRKVVVEGSAIRVAGLASAVGVFFGLWGIWWWMQPPGPMRDLLEAGRRDVLFVRFSVYAVTTTALLILAYWIGNGLMPFVFRPGKVELGVLLVVTVLYYALVTVPAAPRSLWVLPPLMGLTVGALWRNRRLESRADALAGLAGEGRPLHWVLLMLIPLAAMGIYGIGLVFQWRVPTNVGVYYVSSLLGVLMWVGSILAIVMKRGASGGGTDHAGAGGVAGGDSGQPGRRGADDGAGRPGRERGEVL